MGPLAAGELVDRFLAGDCGEAEVRAALDRCAKGGEAGRLLIESLSFAALMESGLMACAANGGNSAAAMSGALSLNGTAECAGATAPCTPAHSDLSVIDEYLAGMIPRDEAREAVGRNSQLGHGIESEWLDALCYESLMREALHSLGGGVRPRTYIGADQVDRYMAGDLEATEQATLFAHTADESQLLPALDEARACESVVRESLRILASGAPLAVGRAEEPDVPGVSVLDDLLDRSLAGALKQSELPLLESAAAESSAARARIQAAERYAVLMQEALRRVAMGAEAPVSASAKGRLLQLPAARQNTIQRRVLIEAARRRRAFARRIATAAGVFITLGMTGVALWLSGAFDGGQGTGDAVPSGPVVGVVNPESGGSGATDTPGVSGKADPTHPGETVSGSEGDEPSATNGEAGGDSSLVAATPERVIPFDSGHAGESGHGLAVPTGTDGDIVDGGKGGGDRDPVAGGDADSGGAVVEAGPDGTAAPESVAIDLSSDLVGLRFEAFDSARRALLELKREDGLFDLYEISGGIAAASDSKAARHLANRLSQEARIRNSAGTQAIVLRALAGSAEGDVAALEAMAVGFDSLAKLVKQKQEYGLLTVRDASGYLLALDEWHRGLSAAKKARRLTPSASASATEAVRHLVSSQSKGGLWGEPSPESVYGAVGDAGTWSAMAGRQIDADLLTTSKAISALEAANRLGIRERQGNAHSRALAAVLSMQSPSGEQVSLPVMEVTPEGSEARATGEVRLASARGWTLIGDTTDAEGKPILRSGAATAAALLVLQTSRSMIPAAERTRRFMATVDGAVADGMAWLAANYTADGNPVGADDGRTFGVSRDYDGMWLLTMRQLAPLMPKSPQGNALLLGGKPWFVELNQALLPALATGNPAPTSGTLDVGTSLAPGAGRESALRIAMALIAVNPSGLEPAAAGTRRGRE